MMHQAGMKYQEIPIAESVDDVEEWIIKLVEAVASYDDGLMEKFFTIQIQLLKKKCMKRLEKLHD